MTLLEQYQALYNCPKEPIDCMHCHKCDEEEKIAEGFALACQSLLDNHRWGIYFKNVILELEAVVTEAKKDGTL